MKPCPQCDAATKVDGTLTIDRAIVRYRVCLNPECRHRFKTTQTQEEYTVEEFRFPPAESPTGK